MKTACFYAALASVLFSPNVQAQKKPLDHSVYDGWKSIRSTSISRDGKWILYVLTPQEGDSVAQIFSVNDGKTISVPRFENIRFTFDSKFVVGTVIPPFEETRKAKRAKTKTDDLPKNSLAVLDLSSGQIRKTERVALFQLPEEDSGYLVYKSDPVKPAVPPPAKKKDDDTNDADPQGSQTPKTEDKPVERKAGDPYVLLNIATGAEEKLDNVASVAFNKSGQYLAYSTATKDGKGDQVVFRNLKMNSKKVVCTGTGRYPKLALSPDGTRLAFTTDRDDVKSKKPALSLYLFSEMETEAKPAGLDSLPKNWSINETHGPEFSHDGHRLIYYTSPKPTPDPEEKADDEKVSVDIWNWQDKKLQPQQLLEVKAEREKGYLAVLDLHSGRSIQLGDTSVPSPAVTNRGEGEFALGADSSPYDRQSSWDPGVQDHYAVDIFSGKRIVLARALKGEVLPSPSGRFAAIFDETTQNWSVTEIRSGRTVNVTQGIAAKFSNELNDVPSPASPYGIAGWTANESRLILEDRYDLWSVDPLGISKPERLTHGREYSFVYRPIKLDPEDRYIKPQSLLLSTFNEETKKAGVSKLVNGDLRRIVLEDKSFGGFLKAQEASTLVYTRQDFTEFPDLWLTNEKFENAKKISDANPQQRNYLWGTAQLVQWTSLDGIPLHGILIKPDNFDYGKKYPMITYFYERNSDTLNLYRPPAPSASTINLSLFVSNGYCIFIPDIPYKTGFPGESAVNAILPGIQSIVNRGYIDPKRLAIQGQSWGGYQVAYLVTRTNMFACAEAGAPVGDMFSAYGGIRYGSGLVRQFQYEHEQSRIGGTPWDSTLKYIENSPVLWADKVQTPLMIMSNDKDGAVPHTQGIELFTALRRLDKPSWLVVYNDEDHNLVQRKNRKDLSIRLGQFFDHYLKGAPAPIWMTKGLPAIDKGRTMGMELDNNP